MPGFPIRKSWDHSLVDSSPRPIAASHVLHRLLVPRHPPFALDNLTTENKMLASTVQFSTNDQPTTPRPPPNPQHRRPSRPASQWYGNQIVPGTERQPLPEPSGSKAPASPARLFLQDPTGCSPPPPAAPAVD